MPRRKLSKTAMAIGTFLLAASVVHAQDLFSVVKDGTPTEVQEAIDPGADVSARNVAGWTPLMTAAENNDNPQVTEVLLSAGAKISARNEDGETPLMLAAEYSENPEVSEVILDAGAEVTEELWEMVQENEALQGTAVYWEINDRRFD